MTEWKYIVNKLKKCSKFAFHANTKEYIYYPNCNFNNCEIEENFLYIYTYC